MAKMYATDKLIMCMIFFILICVIAIVIFSFFFEGDDDAEIIMEFSIINGIFL